MLAAALAGCGNERTAPPPGIGQPEPPTAVRGVALPAGGVALRAPGNWELDRQAGGGRIAVLTSSRATVAIWRYPRSESLPGSPSDLRRARSALVRYVKQRDPTFDASRSRVLRIDRKPALQLLGTQTIAGVRMRVRSTHIFDRGAEIVIDAYAPPDQFALVDRSVFEPLLRSVELTRPTT